jgi:ADP-ribose pyrophosphatase
MRISAMKITSSKEVYSCKIFRVTEDEASDPKGFRIERSIVRHAGSAVMLAVDKKDRVLLVRQYRLPAEQYLWEVPAGNVDAGETPAQAAKRELIEETGLRAKKWKKLVSFYPSPGFVQEKMTVYLAKDLTQGESHPMDDERIETKWFTKKELGEMIRKNRIQDAKTMIAYLYWAKLK